MSRTRKLRIKNSITTDDYLNKIGREHIYGFRGVYSRDAAAKVIPKMKPGQSIIINLDPKYQNGGSHWTALRVSTEAPVIMYTDSFGAGPPEDVRGASLQTGRGLVYSNRIKQKINETNCGKRSLLWLMLMDQADQIGKELEIFQKIS